MFSSSLNQKVYSLMYVVTFLEPCPHFTFNLFPSELSEFGYSLKFPVDVYLQFYIEWFDNQYFLTVRSYFRTPNGKLRASALPSYNKRINKRLSIKNLIESILPQICVVEKINLID